MFFLLYSQIPLDFLCLGPAVFRCAVMYLQQIYRENGRADQIHKNNLSCCCYLKMSNLIQKNQNNAYITKTLTLTE